LNGWALPAIQNSELNSRSIRSPPHQAIKRVNFSNQVSLADPADRGIARHCADAINAMRDESRSATDAGCGGRRLTACVPSPDYDDIEKLHDRPRSLFHVKHPSLSDAET
jgi:hypothetical protein